MATMKISYNGVTYTDQGDMDSLNDIVDDFIGEHDLYSEGSFGYDFKHDLDDSLLYMTDILTDADFNYVGYFLLEA